MNIVSRAAALALLPVLVALAALIRADAPAAIAGGGLSGAIFTTLADGSEVNLNQFPSKEAVYLDGGPGPGAPQGAAALPDGTYVFQVTNPNGRDLLSTDPARCRQFVIAAGIITSVVPQPDSCQHQTGNDIDHNALTVQLFPFNDTTNNGGVYKVWITHSTDLGCSLALVDCGGRTHGFTNSLSKTDNFKVKSSPPLEIDVRFFSDLDHDTRYWPCAPWVQPCDSEPLIPGLRANWGDTYGVSNVRYSNPKYAYGTFAHVEAPEFGTHTMTIVGGDGCVVGAVRLDGKLIGTGSGTVVPVTFDKNNRQEAALGRTHYIDVACN